MTTETPMPTAAETTDDDCCEIVVQSMRPDLLALKDRLFAEGRFQDYHVVFAAASEIQQREEHLAASEARNAELVVAVADYKAVVDATCRGMECVPGCDAEAHDDECPVANPKAAWLNLRARTDAAEEALDIALAEVERQRGLRIASAARNHMLRLELESRGHQIAKLGGIIHRHWQAIRRATEAQSRPEPGTASAMLLAIDNRPYATENAKLKADLLRICGPVCPIDGKRAIEHNPHAVMYSGCVYAHVVNGGGTIECGFKEVSHVGLDHNFVRSHPVWPEGAEWLASERTT